MSLLSFIASKLESARDKAMEIVQDVELEAAYRIGELKSKISDLFGKGDSYDGSISQSIDIEKELAEFRNSLDVEAKNLEKAKIEEVTGYFDVFIENMKDSYPELVTVLEEKKRKIIETVSGTIINDIKKRISENNPSFRSVLEMMPGQNKTEKIREKMTEALEKAERKFDSKLKKKMKELNTELETRLLDELRKKEDILQTETEIYKELEKESLNGQVDIEKQRAYYQYAVEAKACLEKVLNGVG